MKTRTTMSLIRMLPVLFAGCSCLLLSGTMLAQIGAGVTAGAVAGVAQGVTPESTAGASPVQGASSATAPVPNQSILYPGEDFQLGPGDLISVRLFGAPDYIATVRVGLDGTAQLPYIGIVSLQGLTVRAAQAAIAGKLRSGEFYENPEISIQVLESINGSVVITGELRAVVPLTGARRLIDVLASAGGLPASASHTVRIVRPGSDQPLVVNLGADMTHSADAAMLVYPRDIIQISRGGVVYVLGAFKQQGFVPLDQAMPLTLMQLAAMSGGVGFEGKYDDLRLIRTTGAERKVVNVDIKKVLNGQAPDPVLEANDIVFLPTSSMKAIMKNLGTGGILGIVSLLLTVRSF